MLIDRYSKLVLAVIAVVATLPSGQALAQTRLCTPEVRFWCDYFLCTPMTLIDTWVTFDRVRGIYQRCEEGLGCRTMTAEFVEWSDGTVVITNGNAALMIIFEPSTMQFSEMAGQRSGRGVFTTGYCE
jgi:hypothetical protein